MAQETRSVRADELHPHPASPIKGEGCSRLLGIASAIVRSCPSNRRAQREQTITSSPTANAGLIGALPPSLRPYASLMRLDRPIGAWLLFWPGAWAVALAGFGTHGLRLILWLALGAWAMRSAGCVYNDMVDPSSTRRSSAPGCGRWRAGGRASSARW